MSVKRWDAEHEHVNETGEFVLATDYDDLLRLTRGLIMDIAGTSACDPFVSKYITEIEANHASH